MTRLALLALASMALCACGDGRIERALNAGPAVYPLPTLPTIGDEAPERDWYTEFRARSDAEQAEIEQMEQKAKINRLQTQLDDITNRHPNL